MSITSLVLGENWKPAEWPDAVDVLHETREMGTAKVRRYVPERSCVMREAEASCERLADSLVEVGYGRELAEKIASTLMFGMWYELSQRMVG